LLEKACWYSENEPGKAEKFFPDVIKKHPGILGLHLMHLRFKKLMGEKIDDMQWDNLTNNFSGKQTLIKLEYAMEELPTGNGTRLNVAESLRKQLGRDVKRLPASIQQNEKWAVSTIKKTLFNQINTDLPLNKNDLPQLSANHKEYEIMLKGISEQCCNTI